MRNHDRIAATILGLILMSTNLSSVFAAHDIEASKRTILSRFTRGAVHPSDAQFAEAASATLAHNDARFDASLQTLVADVLLRYHETNREANLDPHEAISELKAADAISSRLNMSQVRETQRLLGDFERNLKQEQQQQTLESLRRMVREFGKLGAETRDLHTLPGAAIEEHMPIPGVANLPSVLSDMLTAVGFQPSVGLLRLPNAPSQIHYGADRIIHLEFKGGDEVVLHDFFKSIDIHDKETGTGIYMLGFDSRKGEVRYIVLASTQKKVAELKRLFALEEDTLIKEYIRFRRRYSI